MEAIIRPFTTGNVTPTPFIKPGTVGAPPVRIGPVGVPGGTQTFAFSASGTTTFYMVQVHREKQVNNLAQA